MKFIQLLFVAGALSTSLFFSACSDSSLIGKSKYDLKKVQVDHRVVSYEKNMESVAVNTIENNEIRKTETNYNKEASFTNEKTVSSTTPVKSKTIPSVYKALKIAKAATSNTAVSKPSKAIIFQKSSSNNGLNTLQNIDATTLILIIVVCVLLMALLGYLGLFDLLISVALLILLILLILYLLKMI